MANTAALYHRGTLDALDLLRADHDKIRMLFKEYDSLRERGDQDEHKSEIVDEICYELTLHAMIEEEIFYPAVRTALGDDALLDAALEEHTSARELIAQLEEMYPGDEHFDALLDLLEEEISDHIDREEAELFNAVRSSGIDLVSLCGLLIARKDALDDDLTAPPLQAEAQQPHDGARQPPRAPN